MDRNKMVNKLDSLKNEETKTFGSSKAAMEYLKKLREESMENREWCEHIEAASVYGGYQWKERENSMIFIVSPRDMFCKYCGKPRPKEPEKRKLLWEILRDAFFGDEINDGKPMSEQWQQISEAAFDAVVEVWESWDGNAFRESFPDYLRKELMGD